MNLWRPTSESELQFAIDSGDIVESHYLDFKREIGNSDSSRKETARDLASFALHGGVIVVGVDEPTAGKFELAPTPLENASERVEQIAANRLDPGLFIRTTVIPSTANPAAGYLIVEIPPSLAAPHMVDGRYWGRSERTKRQLPDPEVVQLHAGHVITVDRVRAALTEELQRDPTPRPPSRMFLVAEPLQADSGLARTFVRGDPKQMLDFAVVAEGLVPESVQSLSTSPYDLGTAVRRSRGLARTRLDEGRSVHNPRDAEYAEDIEVQITGAIRLLTSGITHRAEIPRVPGELPFVHAGHAIAWVHRLIGYAAYLGPALEYRGPWGFGVHIYGLSGARASTESHRAFQLPVYEADTFEALTSAQLTEMTSSPSMIADRLIGDLIHALGVSKDFPDALAPAELGSP